MRELDNRLMRHIDLLVERYPSLESAKNDIVAAYLLLEESYENGGKLLVAGNGGSAADAEHIVGELMKASSCLVSPKLILQKGWLRESGTRFCSGRKPAGGTSCYCTGWASCSVHSLHE